MRRLLPRLFLAAALLVAQHGVYAHALSHFEEDLYRGKGDAKVDHGRGVCVAFTAASAGAVGSTDPPLCIEAAPCSSAGPDAADPLLSPLALTRFASRAPPLPA